MIFVFGIQIIMEKVFQRAKNYMNFWTRESVNIEGGWKGWTPTR